MKLLWKIFGAKKRPLEHLKEEIEVI